MVEKRICPKCEGEMIQQPFRYALVQFIDAPAKKELPVNLKTVLPVEVYHCGDCRHVELEAG